MSKKRKAIPLKELVMRGRLKVLRNRITGNVKVVGAKSGRARRAHHSQVLALINKGVVRNAGPDSPGGAFDRFSPVETESR